MTIFFFWKFYVVLVSDFKKDFSSFLFYYYEAAKCLETLRDFYLIKNLMFFKVVLNDGIATYITNKKI